MQAYTLHNDNNGNQKVHYAELTLYEQFSGILYIVCDEIDEFATKIASIQMAEIEYYIYISYEMAITAHTHIYPPHSDAND